MPRIASASPDARSPVLRPLPHVGIALRHGSLPPSGLRRPRPAVREPVIHRNHTGPACLYRICSRVGSAGVAGRAGSGSGRGEQRSQFLPPRPEYQGFRRRHQVNSAQKPTKANSLYPRRRQAQRRPARGKQAGFVRHGPGGWVDSPFLGFRSTPRVTTMSHLPHKWRSKHLRESVMQGHCKLHSMPSSAVYRHRLNGRFNLPASPSWTPSIHEICPPAFMFLIF